MKKRSMKRSMMTVNGKKAMCHEASCPYKYHLRLRVSGGLRDILRSRYNAAREELGFGHADNHFAHISKRLQAVDERRHMTESSEALKAFWWRSSCMPGTPYPYSCACAEQSLDPPLRKVQSRQPDLSPKFFHIQPSSQQERNKLFHRLGSR